MGKRNRATGIVAAGLAAFACLAAPGCLTAVVVHSIGASEEHKRLELTGARLHGGTLELDLLYACDEVRTLALNVDSRRVRRVSDKIPWPLPTTSGAAKGAVGAEDLRGTWAVRPGALDAEKTGLYEARELDGTVLWLPGRVSGTSLREKKHGHWISTAVAVVVAPVMLAVELAFWAITLIYPGVVISIGVFAAYFASVDDDPGVGVKGRPEPTVKEVRVAHDAWRGRYVSKDGKTKLFLRKHRAGFGRVVLYGVMERPEGNTTKRRWVLIGKRHWKGLKGSLLRRDGEWQPLEVLPVSKQEAPTWGKPPEPPATEGPQDRKAKGKKEQEPAPDQYVRVLLGEQSITLYRLTGKQPVGPDATCECCRPAPKGPDEKKSDEKKPEMAPEKAPEKSGPEEAPAGR